MASTEKSPGWHANALHGPTASLGTAWPGPHTTQASATTVRPASQGPHRRSLEDVGGTRSTRAGGQELTAAQERSDDGVGTAVSYCCGVHALMAVHTRLLVGVGGAAANCVDVHVDSGRHTVSARRVHVCAWKLSAAHELQVAHARLDVGVHAMASNVTPAMQGTQPWHVASCSGVHAVSSVWLTGHTEQRLHWALDVGVAGTDANVGSVHGVIGAHDASDVGVGGTAWYWAPAEHCVTVTHARLLTAGLNDPTGQGWHPRSELVEALVATTVPAAHAVHERQVALLLRAAKDATTHEAHCRSLVGVALRAIYCPKEHVVNGVHCWAPLEAEKEAAGQAWQVGCWAALPGSSVNCPGVHKTVGGHGPVWLPRSCVNPSAHGTQGVAADESSSVVPGKQVCPAQLVPPGRTYCPGGHVTQTPPMAAVPALHVRHRRSEVAVGGVAVTWVKGQVRTV